MQHIIQIAFDFDDDRVTKKIESSIMEDVTKRITSDIERQMFQSYGWNKEINPERDDLRDWVKNVIREEFIAYKDDIIARVVKDLVDSAKRSKAFKDKLNDGLT